MTGSTNPFGNALGRAVRDLHPAYFAMVMATGIVSTGADLLGMAPIALALFWLNSLIFIVLCCLTVGRLIRHYGEFLADLIDHNRAPGFFAIVAGACILGTQWLIILESPRIALALWLLAITLWLVLDYVYFTGVPIKETKPRMAEVIYGGWLFAVVQTQPRSVHGVRLSRFVDSETLAIIFFAL